MPGKQPLEYPVQHFLDQQGPTCEGKHGDGRPMELDTGAAYTLVSETTFKELWPASQVSTTQVRLRSYSGEAIGQDLVRGLEARLAEHTQCTTGGSTAET